MREDPVSAEFWRKQANWVVVGFFAFMITSLIDYHWIRWGALPMYLAGIVFLILTKFIGQRVYGARSWLHIGPINFQPAQLAVVAGNHGSRFVPQSVSPNASDAARLALRRDCRSALSFDLDAARPGRMHHLGSGFARALFSWAEFRCAI